MPKTEGASNRERGKSCRSRMHLAHMRDDRKSMPQIYIYIGIEGKWGVLCTQSGRYRHTEGRKTTV